MRDGYDEVSGIKNIGMDDVDRLILKHIKELLPKGCDHSPFKERQAALRQIVEKVIIHEERIDLVLKTENGPETRSIAIQLQKVGQKKLILDSEGKDIVPRRANKDPALIKALVRAHKWEKALANNTYKSIGAIAKSEDLELRYFVRIYRLIFLAPKIKEAILDGMQPRTLTLSRLMEGVPPSWQEQERLYGL